MGAMRKGWESQDHDSLIMAISVVCMFMRVYMLNARLCVCMGGAFIHACVCGACMHMCLHVCV